MSSVSGSARSRKAYDLVVIGGGIHGLMIALVAAETGLRPLLLERDRPGAATSAAWFGILHGGLRYLQNLDIGRLRESVAARRWFLQAFPDLVRPLPFLMPLYGQGLKRPEIFRLAFLADAILTADRNRDVPASCQLAKGQALTAAGVIERFPGVRRDGLKGGALWQEAVVPDVNRLFSALLGRAREVGVEICIGAEVEGVLQDGGRVLGVRAADAATYDAPVVINAAGPWSGALAARLDPTTPPLFHPVLGFNLLLDRPPPAPCGVSLSPPGQDGPMLFLYPQGARTFAGTWYAPWQDPSRQIVPDREAVRDFLQALNACVPGLRMTEEDIVGVSAGLLPAAAAGSTDLLHRDILHEHARTGGPQGLFSVTGVKYTTAREVARRVLSRAGLLQRNTKDRP